MTSNSSGRARRSPQKAASTSSGGLTDGELLEIKLANYHFGAGWFCRAGVDLSERFHPEPLQLTDLDLLAMRFDHDLRVTKLIGECKTGTSNAAPKPLDRAMWLSGLQRITGADGAVLVTRKSPTRQMREVTSRLRVTAISEADLERRLAALGSVVRDVGSSTPQIVLMAKRVKTAVRAEPDLEKAYRFVRSEVWHADPWVAAKRLIQMLRVVARHAKGAQTAEEVEATRYLLTEGSVVFAAILLQVASVCYWLPEQDLDALVTEKLSEGLAPTPQLVRLSEAVDRHIASLLHELKAPSSLIVRAGGAFYPRPPDYTEAFTELLHRVCAKPRIASEVPRLMDVALYEAGIKSRVVTLEAIALLGLPDVDQCHRVARLIGAFLSGQAEVPREIFTGLGFVAKAVEPVLDQQTPPELPLQ